METLRPSVPPRGEPVIVGTIGRSPLIDGLIAAGKLDVTGIAGNWETSLEQVVRDPLPGIRRAFVIAGSDQRGTHLRHLRRVQADRGVPVVLVGRRSRPARGHTHRAARTPHAGHPGGNRQWERNTSDNVNRTATTHLITTPGPRALKFWMVDPTVIAQKFILEPGGLQPSYLGAPESLLIR